MKKILIALFASSCYLGAGIELDSQELKQAKSDTPNTMAEPQKKMRTEKNEKQPPITSLFFAKKTFSTMNFEELKERKQELVKTDKVTAIKYLERMVHMCADLDELRILMLELAQLLYDTNDYVKASKMYHEFSLLYPGADEVEYALYQAINSSFKLILDAEHDQTKTHETKELAASFLERSTFTTYRNQVEHIVHLCDERLFESELNIFNFYVHRGNFYSAENRLTQIKQIYASKSIPNFDMRVAQLDLNFATLEKPSLPQEIPLTVAIQDKTNNQELGITDIPKAS